MTGTDRLSPYIGGYLDLSFTNKNTKKETQLNLNDNKREVGYEKKTSGSLGIGLNAVAGFDPVGAHVDSPFSACSAVARAWPTSIAFQSGRST